MRAFILFISIFTAFFSTEIAWAQRDCFLANDGDSAKYSVMIDFAKAYISGIGIMARQENKIVCTVFNEFGVSVLSFSYDTDKKRTKLLNTIGFINKWYIKRVIKQDVNNVMSSMDTSGTTYINKKKNIIYTFTPLIEQNATTE